MNINQASRPVGMMIHPDFMHAIAVNHASLASHLKAIAVNAVGQAITLAVLGTKVKSMTMPNMSSEAKCMLVIPDTAPANGLMPGADGSTLQAQLLDLICVQISGAVAEYCFDEFDHYGNLGLKDIEGSYGYLSAFKSQYNAGTNIVLAGCTIALEQMFNQHYETAEAMAKQLAQDGSISEPDMARYLSDISPEDLGVQVLAALQEPWIENEAERVHRIFIGS
jgi:hypothetical protein